MNCGNTEYTILEFWIVGQDEPHHIRHKLLVINEQVCYTIPMAEHVYDERDNTYVSQRDHLRFRDA